MSTSPNLLSAHTTSSAGDTLTLGTNRERFIGSLYVWGTIGGATVKIQDSPDGTNWFDITDGTWTTLPQRVNIETHGPYVRGIVSSAGGATTINMHLE